MAKEKNMPIHDQLRQLREVYAEERAGVRDLEALVQAAQVQAGQAREALIEAHVAADTTDIKNTGRAETKSKEQLDDLALRMEAGRRRVDRARQQADNYERDHAQELIGELKPEAIAARDKLATAAAALVKADTEWHDVLAQVNRLVAADPGGSPKDDITPNHHLATVVADLKRALRDGEVVVPLPHNRHRLAAEDGERRNLLTRLTRQARPSAEDQAEIDRLRREIGVTP